MEPPLFNRCPHAALAQIAAHWWPLTGCSAKKLLERILFELVPPTAVEPQGWQVFSYRMNRCVAARTHYLSWASVASRESDNPEDWLHAYLGEDIGLTPDQVERLATALNVPLPSWLANWRLPSGVLAPNDAILQLHRKYQHPTRHPRRWPGFCDEVRKLCHLTESQLTDNAIRLRWKRWS